MFCSAFLVLSVKGTIMAGKRAGTRTACNNRLMMAHGA